MDKLLIISLLSFVFIGCETQQSREELPSTTAEGKIILQPSSKNTLILDSRPEQEKISRIEKYPTYEAKLIGDSDFTHSPLHLVASNLPLLGGLSESNRVKITSLRVRVYDEDGPSSADPAATDDVAYGIGYGSAGPVGAIIAVPMFRLFSAWEEPDSYLVEVTIKAKYQGVEYEMSHLRVATHRIRIPDTVVSTIAYTSKLLGNSIEEREAANN